MLKILESPSLETTVLLGKAHLLLDEQEEQRVIFIPCYGRDPVTWINPTFNSVSGGVSRYPSKAKRCVVSSDLLWTVGLKIVGG